MLGFVEAMESYFVQQQLVLMEYFRSRDPEGIRKDKALLKLREHRLFAKAERWAKVSPFLTTALFAALPLPYLFARVLIPLSGYPLPRYAAAVSLGRFARVFVIATFGTFVDIPDRILLALLGAGVAISLGAALTRQIRARRAASRPEL